MSCIDRVLMSLPTSSNEDLTELVRSPSTNAAKVVSIATTNTLLPSRMTKTPAASKNWPIAAPDWLS